MPSYSPVFSTQFVVRPAAQPLPAFEVPAGFTAVIRDFSIYGSATGGGVLLRIQNSATATPVAVAQLEGIGLPYYQQWQGRVVVPGGGLITNSEYELGNAFDVYVGGYLLRNNLT